MKSPAYTVTLDADRSRGLLTLHQSALLPDILAGGAALLAHPEWQDGFDEVWDLRALGSAPFSIRDVKVLLDFDMQTSEGIRRTAVVVERFGLRMLALSYAQIVARRRPIRIFDTLEEALAWLDAP